MDTKSISNSPLKWVPSAYLAMGFPFVIINIVTVLMFKGMGVSDAGITFWTSLLSLPWTIKFLWSPFLESAGSKKHIVAITQLICGVGFGLTALALHADSFFAMCITCLAMAAFSGATHDVALDGLYMESLDNKNQSKFIGWQGAFYNIARLLASGGLVYMAGALKDYFSKTTDKPDVPAWSVIMGLSCMLMIILSLYHFKALPKTCSRIDEPERKNNIKEVIISFFRQKYVFIYILFIICYRLSEGFVMKVITLFLNAGTDSGGLGLNEQHIGIMYGTLGAVAFVLGSMIAGYIIPHFGLKKALFPLVCIFNFPFLIYALLAWFQPSSLLLIGSGIVFEYFGYGFGFVGLTLFMMQQIAPGPYRMAHYAIASGIMNLSVMVTGAMSGRICEAVGYKYFFLIVVPAAIPAILMSLFIPFRHKEN